MENIRKDIANKQRIVITGCRQVSFFASILAHVLKFHGKKFDWIQQGEPVVLSGDAPIAIILSSENKDDKGVASFRNYEHHIGVITEIEHTLENGYLDEDDYIRQYDLFADATPKAGFLAYSESDQVASVLCNKERADVSYIAYKAHASVEESGVKYLINSHKDKFKVTLNSTQDLKWFGGAKELLKRLGISSEQFYQAIPTFQRP